jgi:hypothetical protein
MMGLPRFIMIGPHRVIVLIALTHIISHIVVGGARRSHAYARHCPTIAALLLGRKTGTDHSVVSGKHPQKRLTHLASHALLASEGIVFGPQSVQKGCRTRQRTAGQKRLQTVAFPYVSVTVLEIRGNGRRAASQIALPDIHPQFTNAHAAIVPGNLTSLQTPELVRVGLKHETAG